MVCRQIIINKELKLLKSTLKRFIPLNEAEADNLHNVDDEEIKLVTPKEVTPPMKN